MRNVSPSGVAAATHRCCQCHLSKKAVLSFGCTGLCCATTCAQPQPRYQTQKQTNKHRLEEHLEGRSLWPRRLGHLGSPNQPAACCSCSVRAHRLHCTALHCTALHTSALHILCASYCMSACCPCSVRARSVLVSYTGLHCTVCMLRTAWLTACCPLPFSLSLSLSLSYCEVPKRLHF